MKLPRVLSVQDLSCVGKCSLTVALPVLSACGVEVCALPTAVLSTHTGFPDPHIRDLTDDLAPIAACWRREGIIFDAIATGYLGSIRQTQLLAELLPPLLKPGGKLVVDPAMADGGALYTGFDEDSIPPSSRRWLNSAIRQT